MSMSGSIPETLFVKTQLTFAVITPALIVGGFAGRMLFSAMLIFGPFLLVMVYAPTCHWGVGRRLVRWHGAPRFRRRFGCPYRGWRCGLDRGHLKGWEKRFWLNGYAASQSDHDSDRRRDIMDSMVRF